MWECEFDNEIKYLTEDEKDFIEQLDLVKRLDLHDAFYSRRSGPLVMYSRPTNGFVIRFNNVKSMYSDAMKKGIFPLYHPIIITRNFKHDVTEYFGLIKVRILQPKNLYIPKLPYRIFGKLKFPLCRTCAEQENYALCTCSAVEQSFVGTFATCELIRGLEAGYQIVKIFEIYHWPYHTQYNPHTKSDGLFTEYVDTFLKLKTDASGYPAWCLTENDKETYVNSVYENEGIKLDTTKIEYNPGLRLIAKAFLNNLWGRLGLRDNLPQTEFTRTPDSFFEIIK